MGVKFEFDDKKVDAPMYSYQSQWYYVENLNLCKEVPSTSSNKDKFPIFDSKRVCEETCRIAPCILTYCELIKFIVSYIIIFF